MLAPRPPAERARMRAVYEQRRAELKQRVRSAMRFTRSRRLYWQIAAAERALVLLRECGRQRASTRQPGLMVDSRAQLLAQLRDDRVRLQRTRTLLKALVRPYPATLYSLLPRFRC